MRLIDVDKLNARLSRDGTPYFTVYDIENAPTVDAIPVIRCEKWIPHGKHNDVFECSACHEEIWDEQTPYCPYCGAKMDGRN